MSQKCYFLSYSKIFFFRGGGVGGGVMGYLYYNKTFFLIMNY